MLIVKKLLTKILNSIPTVDSFSTGSITVSAYYANRTIDVSKSGKTPIGVIGWQCNQAVANIYRLDITGTTLNIGVSTIDKSNLSACSVRAYVLYI